MPVFREKIESGGEHIVVTAYPSLLTYDLPKDWLYLMTLDMPAAILAANSVNADELETSLAYFLEMVDQAQGQEKAAYEKALRKLMKAISTRLDTGSWKVRRKALY